MGNEGASVVPDGDVLGAGKRPRGKAAERRRPVGDKARRHGAQRQQQADGDRAQSQPPSASAPNETAPNERHPAERTPIDKKPTDTTPRA